VTEEAAHNAVNRGSEVVTDNLIANRKAVNAVKVNLEDQNVEALSYDCYQPCRPVHSTGERGPEWTGSAFFGQRPSMMVGILHYIPNAFHGQD
jgi:hypothetical protein